MGTNISPSTLRGLSIPLEVSSEQIWASEASYTEQGPLAGPATASSGVKLIIETTGAQSETINIQTKEAGQAGTGAGFIWKKSTDTDYYGSECQNALTGLDFLAIESGVSAIYKPPQALAVSDGAILVAYEQAGTVSPGIKVKRRPADESEFGGGVMVFNNSATPPFKGSGSYPALCELEDGSILCAWWVSYTFTTNTSQIYTARSIDGGVTWVQISAGALDVAQNTSANTISRLQMEAYNGQILLIADVIVPSATNNQNCLFQAVSIDEGGTFVTVGALTDAEFQYQPNLITTSKGMVITYIHNDNGAKLLEIPHAFFPIGKSLSYGAGETITTKVVAAISGATPSLFTDGSHFSFSTADNRIWAFFRRIGATANNSNGAYWGMVTEDGGDNWLYVGNSADPFTDELANIYNQNNSSLTLSDVKVIEAQGKVWLFHRVSSSGGSHDQSLFASYMSGYSSLLYPERVDDGKFYQRFGWAFTWGCEDYPNNGGNVNAFGSGTASFDLDGLQLDSTTSGSDYKKYRYTPPIAVTEWLVRATIMADSGGSLASMQRGIEIEIDGAGVAHWAIQVRVSTTEIRVIDVHSATSIGTAIVSPVGTLQDTGCEIMVALSSSTAKASAWYRPADHNDSKTWLPIVQDGSVTDGGAMGGIDHVTIGHHAVAATTMESHIREWLISYGAMVGKNLAEGFSNPSDLIAADYPWFGRWRYLYHGLLITTKDGPAFDGDTYTITPRAEYGIDRAFYASSPTPQNGWRSVAVSSGAVASQFIPIQLDSNGQDIHQFSDLFCLHLEGINWRQATLEGYDSVGGWGVIATIDTSITDQRFSRKGKTLLGDAASTDKPYFFHHEMAGWSADLNATTVRAIKTNSEGSWSGYGGSRACIASLEGVEAGDPTSGPIELIPNNVSVVVSLNGAEYSAIGLRITSQRTATNDIRIGLISMGPVYIFAPQYGRGRTVAFTPNVEVFDQIDGITRLRKRGVGAREFNISWAEPVDTSQVYGSNPSPNYYMSSGSAGAEAVANWGDLPMNLIGYMRALSSAVRPVVFLPALSTSSDVRVIVRYSEQALCVIHDEVEIESVLGDEFSGEIFRVATLKLKEVI